MGLDSGIVARHAARILRARERVGVIYRNAPRRGSDSPAVLLLDPLELSARRIVAAGSGTDPVAFIEEARRRGGYPTCTTRVPLAGAAPLLAADFPATAWAIRVALDRGGKDCIIFVAEGSASPIAMPPLLEVDLEEWGWPRRNQPRDGPPAHTP